MAYSNVFFNHECKTPTTTLLKCEREGHKSCFLCFNCDTVFHIVTETKASWIASGK